MLEHKSEGLWGNTNLTSDAPAGILVYYSHAPTALVFYSHNPPVSCTIPIPPTIHLNPLVPIICLSLSSFAIQFLGKLLFSIPLHGCLPFNIDFSLPLSLSLSPSCDTPLLLLCLPPYLLILSSHHLLLLSPSATSTPFLSSHLPFLLLAF